MSAYDPKRTLKTRANPDFLVCEPRHTRILLGTLMLHSGALHMSYSFDVALSREVTMACNPCETNFQGSHTLVVSVDRSGNRAFLRIRNQSRNIVLINRILLCLTRGVVAGTTTWYLRPPPLPSGLIWLYPFEGYLEPITDGSSNALFSILHGISHGDIVQAQAEYIEIEGRSRSCQTTF